MPEYSKDAAAIAKKHIDEIDEENFDGALWEALEKNLKDELLDVFEKAGIILAKETVDAAEERYQKYLEGKKQEHQ